MTAEIPDQNAVRNAQVFFAKLHSDTRGGPLDDEIETLALSLEVNKHIEALTRNGEVYPDGSRAAEYGALVDSGQVDIEEGEFSVAELHNQPLGCALRYSEEGFEEGIESTLIKWSANLEGDDGFVSRIVCDLAGNIGHHEPEGTIVFQQEYGRGLIVVAMNLTMVFHPDVFVQRDA